MTLLYGREATRDQPATLWFTMAVFQPRPAPVARYVHDDDEHSTSSGLLLLLQREYPVDAYGSRIPGSDWLDTRTVLGDYNERGVYEPVGHASNLDGIASAAQEVLT